MAPENRTLKLNTSASAMVNLVPAVRSPIRPQQSPEVESCHLNRRFADIAVQAATLADLVQRIKDLLVQNSECLGLWIAPCPKEAQETRTFRPLLDRHDNPLWTILAEETCRVAEMAAQNGSVQSFPVNNNPRNRVVVAAVWSEGKTEEVLAGCFSHKSCTTQRSKKMMMLATTTIAMWRVRRLGEASSQVNRSLQQSLQLLTSISSAESFHHSAIAAVNNVKQLLGVQHVVLARFREKQATTISAISDVECLAAGNDHLLSLRQCVNELRGQTSLTGTVSCPQAPLAALSNYRQLAGAEDAVYLPLMVQDQPFGGMLIGGDKAKLQSKSFEEFAAFLSGHVSPVLAAAHRADNGIFDRLRQCVGQFVRRNSGRKLGLAIASIMIVALCPFPHRVACQSELQPVLRRFVAAPFEGVLNSVQVKCGDVVKQDQLLAVMDGNILRMELAGLQAQLAAAQKKRDSTLAQGNIAESQIAKSEAKRHESQIGLIQSRLDRLEIRSPISGVIVSGDMDKVEGARMEMGQSLFEVAPLESMQVEVQIPENDSRLVRDGQMANLKFSAYPFKKWSGPIARVHPRSELVEDSNVFIAEVQLDNRDGDLRPGMKGHAFISTAWRPIAWIWLHHAWERMRYAFVW